MLRDVGARYAFREGVLMKRSRVAILAVVLLGFVLLARPAASAEARAPIANLVFIHHSVGANWLNDGLCQSLNDNGFHVADIYYGWTGGTSTVYGDHTDTSDWPTWFTDSVMGLVYPEMDAMTAPNALDPVSGENTVIVFKSCYPSSDVGDDITDEQAVYNSLLAYFQAHPDKMFVLVTPPPMQSISNPAKTRELCNWLTDRQSGWLKDLTSKNVFVYDLFNVLTHPDAHHKVKDFVEFHSVVPGYNTLYYPSGDDHPSTVGNEKATAEFVPLLRLWYAEFSGGAAPPPVVETPARYQQTDPSVFYTGKWRVQRGRLFSGWSQAYAKTRGASVTVSFSGTQLDLVATRSRTNGMALVSVDGGAPVRVDLYSRYTLPRQTVFSTGELGDGLHWVQMTYTRVKNRASRGYTINLDAVDVTGTPMGNTFYQETSDKLVYAGSWWPVTSARYSGSGSNYADSAGSSVTIPFKGVRCSLIGTKARAYGKAKVFIDGAYAGVVDFYNSRTRYNQVLWNSPFLSPGNHTVTVNWTGTKSHRARGTMINLDAVGVVGTM
jgi:hypothetical protein